MLSEVKSVKITLLLSVGTRSVGPVCAQAFHFKSNFCILASLSCFPKEMNDLCDCRFQGVEQPTPDSQYHTLPGFQKLVGIL